MEKNLGIWSAAIPTIKKAGLVSSFSVVYHLGVGPLGVVELSTRIVLALVGMRPKIITLSLND